MKDRLSKGSETITSTQERDALSRVVVAPDHGKRKRMAKPTRYGDLDDGGLYTCLTAGGSEAELAFAELYSRYSHRIYGYCMTMLGHAEEANDVFQDTFVKFYNSAVKGQTVANVPGYLFRIARNLCLNHKRDSKVTIEFDEIQFLSFDDSYEKKELLKLLQTSIDLLEDEYREALILREIYGMNYAEMAEITEDSIPALRNRVWRAKDKLREILSPYLSELSNLK